MTSIRLLAPTEKFGYDLLGQEVERNPGKNVWISPSTVSIPLGMLLNSARTSTRKALLSTLGLPYEDDLTNNISYANLISALKDEATGVKVANSIWANKNVKFKRAFLKANREHFGAKVTTRNFGLPKTLTDINGWVSKETEEKIDKLIEEMSPDAIMYLLSATYFKKTWKTLFDKLKTRMWDIQLGNGEYRPHPMMTLPEGGFHGWKPDVGQFGLLPFDGDRVNFIGILPEEGQGLMDVIRALQPGFVREAVKTAEAADHGIYFPRFRIAYKSELNHSLKALGLEEAFHDGADFSGLSTDPSHISRVLHKAMAQFDEVGAVAAAATAVEQVTESCVMPLIFNRPFVGLISDQSTGALLFAGAINDPEVITEETDWSQETANIPAEESAALEDSAVEHEVLHEVLIG